MTTEDLIQGLERAAIWLRGYEANCKAQKTHADDMEAMANAARAADLENLVERYRNLHGREA